MPKLAQLSVTAQNQWSSFFKVEKGTALISLSVEDGSSISIVRYDPADGTTAINTKKITKSQVLENPAKGRYKVGCATGDYVSNCTVTVEQE